MHNTPSSLLLPKYRVCLFSLIFFVSIADNGGLKFVNFVKEENPICDELVSYFFQISNIIVKIDLLFKGFSNSHI